MFYYFFTANGYLDEVEYSSDVSTNYRYFSETEPTKEELEKIFKNWIETKKYPDGEFFLVDISDFRPITHEEFEVSALQIFKP